MRCKGWVILYGLMFLTFLFPSFAMAGTYRTEHIEKKGNSFEVTVDYPQFKDPDTKEQNANKVIKRYVHSLFDKHLKRFVTAKRSKEEIRDSVNPDCLYISFDMIYLDENRISIHFKEFYMEIGAAHPLDYSHCFNYDLRRGRVIKLGDIFKRGTPYLEQLSAYCIKDLHSQLRDQGVNNFVDDGWLEYGASPNKENFKEFCIGGNELILYFDEYQVACYAAGPLEVKIPFKKLTGFHIN